LDCDTAFWLGLSKSEGISRSNVSIHFLFLSWIITVKGLIPDFLFEIEAIAFMMAATPVFMRL
jgi:hypothetical protein